MWKLPPKRLAAFPPNLTVPSSFPLGPLQPLESQLHSLVFSFADADGPRPVRVRANDLALCRCSFALHVSGCPVGGFVSVCSTPAASREAVDMEGEDGILEVLPDAVVQHMLSFIHNARDVAACSCVCKKWKEAMCQGYRLYFARNVSNDVKRSFGEDYEDDRNRSSDGIVTRMVLQMTYLQELVVYCPFSNDSMLAWISHAKNSLETLELRLDELGDKRPATGSVSKLDCIAHFLHLRTLRLWGVLFTQQPPDWRSFGNLRTLEIVGALFEESVLQNVLRACPILTRLTLLGCQGVRVLSIELEHLLECRLDLCAGGDCFVTISCPRLQICEIQGACWVRLRHTLCLRQLSLANSVGKVHKLEVGRLSNLESLSLRGVQWTWDAITTVLQSATEIRELRMRVEFCGDGDKMEPFPEIDIVSFFASHPKLKVFEAQGAMFAALAQRFSLKQVTPMTRFSCLEEVWVTIRSPLNGDQKLATLHSFIKCCPSLRRLAVKVTQMKTCDAAADDFFFRVLSLVRVCSKVTIE